MTDPDARSMATSGKGSGMVGYNVQVAVDAKHHLIVAHEVTNSGSDRAQLSRMTKAARDAMGKARLRAAADRGYYSEPQIKECADAGIAVMLPKPTTSSAKSHGRFDRADFIYIARDGEYQCPAGERAIYRDTEQGTRHVNAAVLEQCLFAMRNKVTVHTERPTTNKSMGT
jgi:hypothetical protein